MIPDQIIVKSELTYEEYSHKTLIELLIERLKTDSEKECMIDCYLNRRWTKGKVLESSLNFAYYLINELRIKKGDVIFFVADNSDIHAIAIIGVLMTGAIYASISGHSSKREIIEVINKIKPTILIYTNELFQTIYDITKANTFIMKTLQIDGQTKETELPSIEKIFEISRHSSIELPRKGNREDCVTIVMSSGSTGDPKAIICTNRNYLANLAVMQHKEICPLTPQDIYLSNGFCHMCGQRSLFSSINTCAQLAIIRMEEEDHHIFSNINKYNINTGFLVPTQLNFLSKNYEKYGRSYLQCIRDIVTGGSYLSNSLYNSIVQKFDFEIFRNSYGLSEIEWATNVYISESKNLENISTVGKLCPGVLAKVIDNEGKSLGANFHGELCFKSDQVTPGYLNNTEENSKLFTSDGFLKSGDFGYYDEKGFFFIVGRFKEIIKVEGVIVSPQELEQIILQSNQIENAVVIGIKNEERHEIPKAFVTLVKGSTLTEEQIQCWVDSRVNYYKKLRGGVKIIDKFPLTPLKKINKPMLRSLIWESL